MARRKRSEMGGPPPEPRRRKRSKAAAEPPPPPEPESGRPDSKPPPIDPFASASEMRGDDLELPPIPDMRRGFDGIVKKIFDDGLDVEAAFDEVEASLSVKGALTPGALSKAANSSEDMANKAFRLYVVAKFETEAFMRETEAVVGAMRELATAALQREKDEGKRSKQITDADVVAKLSTIFPDEWLRVCERRDKAKGMLAQIDNLSGIARGRCYTASTLLGAKKMKL